MWFAHFLLPYKCATQECRAKVVMPGSKKNSNIEEQKIAKRISVYKANDNALLKNEQL